MNLSNVSFNLDQPPGIAIDDTGNRFDADGNVFAGPLSGEKLNKVDQFMGFWFALAAFYPDIQLMN